MPLASGSETLSVRFVRREARTTFACPAIVTPRGGQAMPAETIDVSPRGAGVMVARGLGPMTPIELTLSAAYLPADEPLPPLPGVVKTARRVGAGEGGELVCRLGIAYDPLPAGIRKTLRVVARRILGVGDGDGLSGGVDVLMAPALSGSDRG